MKEARVVVSLPKSFKEKYVGKHATKDIIKTYKKCEEQENLLAKKDEEIATLKVQKNKSDTAEVQESKHSCGFYCLDGNGKVDCLKDYDKKGAVHQIRKEACNQHFAFMQSATQSKKEMFIKYTAVAEQFPCRCRFDREDEWFCALKAPTVQKVEYGLKVCQACPTRLTTDLVKKLEAKGKFTETKRYITCGAKETQDAKAGILIWNSKNPNCPNQGYAVPIQACFDTHCSYAKIMQVILK